MCYGCYEKYGEPKIVNSATIAIADTIDALYELQPSGGIGHIVFDDWGLEDHSIRWCLDNKLEPGDYRLDDDGLGEKALNMMLGLTIDERASAMAIHEGWLDRKGAAK